MCANISFERYRELRSRLELSPEIFSESAELADATLNVLNQSLDMFDEATAPDPDTALLRYYELKSLAESHPSDEVVVHKYFVGGGNLISSLIFRAPAHQERALRLYGELKMFLQASTECERPRSHMAAVAFSVVKRIGTENLSLARNIYQDIKHFNDQNPSDDWIASCQADAALSLIELNFRSSFETARVFYGEISSLSSRYKHVDAVVGNHCSAACTLLEGRRETSAKDARKFYRDIQELVNIRPDIIELKLSQLQMCCRGVIGDISADEMSIGSAIFADAEMVALDFCDRTDVRFYLAVITFLWLQKLLEYEPNSVQSVFVKLEALGNAYCDDSDVADFVQRARDFIES